MALTLKYDFATDKSLVADTGPTLTCTRASEATYFDSSGVLQTAANNVARFDHDPSDSNASLGLLIEEARTNLCTYSEDTTDAAWTKDSVIPTIAVTAPDGTATGNKVLENTDGGVHSVLKSTTVTSGVVYTFSCYVKGGLGRDWLAIQLDDGQYAYFDMTNGVFGTTAGTPTLYKQDVGNGWWRVGVTATTGDTAASNVLYSAEADGTVIFAGDAAKGFHCWGAQLEAGSFPTSYIPTTTASVTRAADVISTTTLTWLDTAATAVGTFYVKGQFPIADAVVDALLTLDDGGVTDRFYLERDAAENINFATTNSADTDGASDGAAVIAVNTDFQVAAAYADDDVIAYVNGASSGADATAGIPLTDNPTTLRIGSDSAGNYWNGTISHVQYYPERLANSVVEDLSNGTFPGASFPGTTAGDGGPVWPPRSNDPRWAQLITDSGITATGNFIDDVHTALEALGSTTGDMDTLWKKVKAANSVTDTSEPYLY